MRPIPILSVLAAAACGPGTSLVGVDWTFDGLSCADAGVSEIRFAIAGEILTPDHFTCTEAPVGADLGTFTGGNYQLTITGVDAFGTVTHQVVQTLQVRGGREETFSVDVPRVADSSVASANLTWTFSPGVDCATANVQQVTILVDPGDNGLGGTDAGTVACSTMGTQGAFIEPLTPGLHSFAILGLRQVGNAVQLVYRTHNPPTFLLKAGVTADLTVSAESPP